MSKIAVLDSGVGGLGIFFALSRQNPREYYYFGDNRHAPYGNKPLSYIWKYLQRTMKKIVQLGIRTVVVACNTLCILMLERLRARYPLITFYSIVEETAAQIRGYERVLVLGTEHTIASGHYQKALAVSNHQVEGRSAQTLVSMIEQQQVDMEYLRALCTGKAQALVLGCTHFALIKERFREVFAGDLFDSEQVLRLTNTTSTRKQWYFYTTTTKRRFVSMVQGYFGITVKYRQVRRY